MNPKLHDHRGRALAVLFAAGVLLVATASPAFADTSQAMARAARIQLLSSTVVTSGEVNASNDGSGEVKTGNTTPALSVLGSQTLLSVGVLVQDAIARDDGTSAACAGVVGPGGNIQIGPSNNCIVANGTPGGVVVNLGLATITADAIIASCTADSSGNWTSSASIVNGVVSGLIPIQLPIGTTPNQGVNIPGIASIIVHQLSSGVGEVTVSALDINVLNSVVRVTLGTAHCGPNAITDPIPVIPAAGIPVALATAVLVGGAAWLFHRRRSNAAAAV